MRILNVASLYPPHVVGGAELTLKTLAEEMALLGHEVHVATLVPADTAYRGFEVQNRVRVHRMPLANVYWPWNQNNRQPLISKALWHTIDTANQFMCKQLCKLVRTVQPDLVVTGNLQGWSTAVIPAVKRMNVPVVHVINDYSLLCPQTAMFRNGRNCGVDKARCRTCRVLTAPRANHLNHVDAVVGVSHAVLKTHRSSGLIRHCDSTVIHNPLRSSIPLAIKARSFKKNEFTFGFLGRVEPLKGVESLLSAASQLQQAGLTFQLRIAGRPLKDNYLTELRERWQSVNIEFVGFANASEFFDSVDCLVFPTLSKEALGNVAIEAFARGVPVIGSNTGGIPETIDHGQNGYLFDKDNPEMLARYMREIMSSPHRYNRMSESALEKADDYSVFNCATQYLECFSNILASKQMYA